MSVAPTARTGIGVIGCGAISAIYLSNMQRVFSNVNVVACADLDAARAAARATEFGVARALTVDELLADPEVEIVVNLTTPDAHTAVSLAALEAGKHVYSEKPLAVTRQDGSLLVKAARAKGLRLGCAPDTVLGAGLQACARELDRGTIGRPVAAVSMFLYHSHERWPAFIFRRGAGPLFDMGPYYLTALVTLLGPVQRLSCGASMPFAEKPAMLGPDRPGTVRVEVPTHVGATLEFASGAVASLVTTVEVWEPEPFRLRVYGTDGTIDAPDPNSFGGPVRAFFPGSSGWTDLDLLPNYAENSRGLGVADMADALRTNRPHRASGELAFHVLDVMCGIVESSEAGQHYTPLPTTLVPPRLSEGPF
jgi:predicted dehydrogenase